MHEVRTIDHGPTLLEGAGFRIGVSIELKKVHKRIRSTIDMVPSECFIEHKELYQPEFINKHWELYTEDAKEALWNKWNKVARATKHKFEMLVKFGR